MDGSNERLVYEVPFHQVPDELIEDERTNVYHIAVFSAIARHANKERTAWPSQNRLSKLTGASRNKVKQTIAELEQFGWLTTRNRFDEMTGRYASTVYYLSPSLQGRSHGDQGVGHGVTKGWSRGAQEPDSPNQIQLNQKDTSRAPARGTKQPPALRDELQRHIDERMREIQPYENFGRERGQIKTLAARCRRRDPDNPDHVADAMMAAFQALRESGDKWWRNQPFTPSALSSLWERIEAAGGDIAEQQRREREFKQWVAEG